MTPLRTLFLAAAALASAIAPTFAQAADRVALLIGNTAYPGAQGQAGAWNRLPNAANDVDLVAKALRAVGFEVEVVKDGSHAAISKAIRAFGDRSEGAKMAVLYYAGHGFEYSRHAYFVPVDGPTAVKQGELSGKFIDFEQAANDVAQAEVNVFFIDACRTAVPFVTVSVDEAAAERDARSIDDVDFPQGAKIAILYSTERGRPALDAAPPPKEYSPFAWEVHQDVGIPHVELGTVFGLISQHVADRTAKYDPPQTPYQYGHFGIGAYFNVASAEQAPVSQAPPARLDLDPARLAITDGPVIFADALSRHPFADIRALAEKGDAVAAYLVGSMYELGIGVETDLTKARTWLEKAAAAKTPSGQLALAYFLEHHSQNPGDNARSLALIKAAADQGFAKAQARYGLTYMDGSGVERTLANFELGRTYMRKAAAAGYPYAMFTLALRGAPDEKPRYKAALRRVADKGNSDGNQWLCELAATESDVGGAIKECLAAARANSAVAQARLAIAYHDGSGVDRSAEEARHWARLAMAQAALRADLRTVLSGYGYAF